MEFTLDTEGAEVGFATTPEKPLKAPLSTGDIMENSFLVPKIQNSGLLLLNV
jgi:hypothetical protein